MSFLSGQLDILSRTFPLSVSLANGTCAGEPRNEWADEKSISAQIPRYHFQFPETKKKKKVILVPKRLFQAIPSQSSTR